MKWNHYKITWNDDIGRFVSGMIKPIKQPNVVVSYSDEAVSKLIDTMNEFAVDFDEWVIFSNKSSKRVINLCYDVGCWSFDISNDSKCSYAVVRVLDNPDSRLLMKQLVTSANLAMPSRLFKRKRVI